MPKDHRELRKCWGIGAKRLQQYGVPILQTIKLYLRQQNLKDNLVVPTAQEQQDDEVILGPILSVEEIVRQRMKDAEARGEVLEILD